MKTTKDFIAATCDRFGFDYVDYFWGIYVPARGLLFYPSTSPTEIVRAFSEPVTKNLATVAYCDGSGMTSDKVAGIGVAIYQSGERPVLIAENIGKGTNNVAELRAIWRALQQFPNVNQRMIICSDSEYAIGSMTKAWNASANAELIRYMRADLAMRPNVKFKHVDGHSGVMGNEVADQLANIGRKLVTEIST